MDAQGAADADTWVPTRQAGRTQAVSRASGRVAGRNVCPIYAMEKIFRGREERAHLRDDTAPTTKRTGLKSSLCSWHASGFTEGIKSYLSGRWGGKKCEAVRVGEKWVKNWKKLADDFAPRFRPRAGAFGRDSRVVRMGLSVVCVGMWWMCVVGVWKVLKYGCK